MVVGGVGIVLVLLSQPGNVRAGDCWSWQQLRLSSSFLSFVLVAPNSMVFINENWKGAKPFFRKKKHVYDSKLFLLWEDEPPDFLLSHVIKDVNLLYCNKVPIGSALKMDTTKSTKIKFT